MSAARAGQVPCKIRRPSVPASMAVRKGLCAPKQDTPVLLFHLGLSENPLPSGSQPESSPGGCRMLTSNMPLSQLPQPFKLVSLLLPPPRIRALFDVEKKLDLVEHLYGWFHFFECHAANRESNCISSHASWCSTWRLKDIPGVVLLMKICAEHYTSLIDDLISGRSTLIPDEAAAGF